MVTYKVKQKTCYEPQYMQHSEHTFTSNSTQTIFVEFMTYTK